MAINNSKRKQPVKIKLADQEPQNEQKPERGPGFGDTKNDGNGIDIIPTADYKINLDGKKYKAHRIVFSNGHDDSKKGVSEMKKTLAQFVEELKGNQHKLDKNKNGKLDAEDFKKLRSKSSKMEEEVLDEAFDADDYTVTSEKSAMNSGHRPHVVNKETGKTMHLSATSYKSPAHAKAHAKAYLTGYAKLGANAADRAAMDYAKANKQHMVKEDTEMNEDLHPEAGKVLKHIKPEHHAKYTPDLAKGTYKGDYADRSAVLKAAERAGHLKEASPFDYKNTPRQTSDDTKTKTYHDVKKISTGTVYTKQFDKDGMSKGTGGDAAAKAENAPKRGRGRPKKDKFAESVEVLMSLSEEQFDSMMEEGFDAFFEAYEQLDELSKSTLGSYVKSAAKDAKEAGRDQEYHGHKNDYKRGEKRQTGISKAVDRLTK